MASSLEGIEADFLLEEPTPEASKVVGRVDNDSKGHFQCPDDDAAAEPPAKRSLASNAVEAPSSSMPSVELELHPDQGSIISACFVLLCSRCQLLDPLEHPQFAAVAAVLDQVQRHQEEQLWQHDAMSRAQASQDNENSPNLPRPLLTKLRKAFHGVHTNKNVRLLEVDTLSQLLIYLRPTLQTAARIRLPADAPDAADKARVEDGLEAAWVGLLIMTCPNMPSQVFIEEVIEAIVELVKRQLTINIYPLCEHADTRSRRKSASTRATMGALNKLYQELTKLVDFCGQLTQVQVLSDTILIGLLRFSLQAFFVDSPDDLKLAALNVVKAIFAAYPNHRASIMEDLLLSLTKLPSAKRGVRDFTTNGVSIQMITALVLELLQSIVPGTLKRFHTFDQHTETPPVLTAVLSQALTSTDEEAFAFMHRFWRSATKKDSELRHLFTNFVEDCLRVAFHPDWPVASLLLVKLMPALNEGIFPQEGKQADRISSLRAYALELFGQVVSAFASAKSKAARFQTEMDQPDFAEQPANQAFAELEASRRLQDMLLNSLDHQMKTDSSKYQALAAYFTARFLETEESVKNTAMTEMMELDDDAMSAYNITLESTCSERIELLLQQELKEARVPLVRRGATAFVEGDLAIALSTKLLMDSKIEKAIKVSVRYLQKAAGQRHNTVRAKAIKAMGALVDIGNPEVLQVAANLVRNRHSDIMPAVREASLGLLARVIAQQPDEAHAYIGVLNERLADRATSVRKRVISISEAVIRADLTHTNAISLCRGILARAGDHEDSIQDAVINVFASLWFNPAQSGEALETMVPHLVAVVADPSGTTAVYFRQVLTQLLANPSRKHAKTFGRYVKALFRSEGSLTREQVDSRLIVLREFCRASPELLVGHFNQLRSLAAKHLAESKEERAARLASVKDQTQIPIYQRLRSQRLMDANIVNNTTAIITAILPLLPSPSDAHLKDLEEALMRHVVWSPSQVLAPVVACLAQSVARSGNLTFAQTQLEKFYECLKKVATSDGKSANLLHSVPRALISSGLFCRYFTFQQEEEDDAGEINRPLNEERITDVVYLVLYHFASKYRESDPAPKNVFQRNALDAMSHFFIQHPRMIMRDQIRELLRDSLINGSATLQTAVLNLLSFFLAEEEQDLEAKVLADQAAEDAAREDAASDDGDAETGNDGRDLGSFGGDDSGVSTPLVGDLIDVIRQGAVSRHPSVRDATSKLLAVIVRRGLCLPTKTVDMLIALASDKVFETSGQGDRVGAARQAEAMLHALYYKKTSVVESGVRPGFQQAFKLHSNSSLEGRPIGYHVLQGKQYSMMRPVYKLLTKRQQKQRFLSALFDCAYSKATRNGTKLELVAFGADCLATLDYSSVDDVLFVIHKIMTTAARATADIIEAWSAVVGMTDVTIDDEQRRNAGFVQVFMDKAVKNGKGPELAKLAAQSKVWMLLLLARGFLQSNYGLSEKQCNDYLPTDSKTEKPPSPQLCEWNPQVCHVLDDVPEDAASETLTSEFVLLGELLDGELPNGFAPPLTIGATPTRVTATPSAGARTSTSKPTGSGKRRGSARAFSSRRQSATKKAKRKKTFIDSDDEDDGNWQP
eukprot:m.118522 g.118522  ORF g.118522 m.118522 type:complete len:1596 (+) comp15567_c0_seq1:193-4980(+)